MPTSKPFFSIIVPTYNSSKTLADCLESILTQTFADFEIILMDGISNDSTLEIAKSFQENRLRIISQKDHGIYDAMNKGIKIANGKYLYFLGSDDKLYNNEVLVTVHRHLNSNAHLHILYANVEVNGEISGREFNAKELFHNNICHQSIFYREDVFETLGVFNTKYLASADWHHNLAWMRNPKINKRYVNEVIAVFNLGGFSTQYYDKLFHDHLNWEYLVHSKNEISLVDKLRMSKAAIKNTIKERQFLHLIKLLFQIPKFLLRSNTK